MTTFTTYVCDVCNTAYEDEQDCKNCELKHIFSELNEGDLKIFDKDKKELKFFTDQTFYPDDIFFIKVKTISALGALQDWASIYDPYGIELPYNDINKDAKTGLYYYDTRFDCWKHYETELEELQNYYIE